LQLRNNNEQWFSRWNKRAIAGRALYWSSFFILIFVEFLLGGQLSKMLTKENYSVYVNVLNTLPFYNVLVNIGLSYSIVFIVAYNKDIKYNLFGQALRLQAAWYFIIVGIHFVFYLVFKNVFAASLLITAVISFTYTYKLNINSFFLATGSYNRAAVSNSLQKTALLAVFLFFNYYHLKRQLNFGFMLVYPGVELAIVLLYFAFFSRTGYLAITAPAVNYRKRMIQYGKYALFNNGLSMLYYTFIIFIITSSHIDTHLKIIFGLCFMFFRYAGVAVAPVISMVAPQFTVIKNNLEKVRKLYKRQLLIIGIISVLTMIMVRLLFGFVITHFYAKPYYDLPIYFYFFSYLIPLSFINSLNATVIAAMGKIKYTFKTEVVCTCLLGVFFLYNLWSPVSDYHFFYYIVLIHLTVKFLMQAYGSYSVVNGK
jgi:O-antigen/teichoic acid export membrane protein